MPVHNPVSQIWMDYSTLKSSAFTMVDFLQQSFLKTSGLTEVWSISEAFCDLKSPGPSPREFQL